jgi:amino acid transporter
LKIISTISIKRKTITILPLVMTIFFAVSGGPYGLEPVMQSGLEMGLLLILLTPLVWALPAALLTAELSSAIPAEGGYYVWVKRAMGPAAGFFCAWLTYVYTWVDVAIYPVLYISYLKTFAFASFLANPWYSFATTLAFIVPLSWLNISGIKSISRVSTGFFILLLIPFAIMIIAGSDKILTQGFSRPQLTSGSSISDAFTAGLFVIMWNYLGWDSLSTVTGEIKNPQKVFPKALMVAVPVVVLIYFLPALIGASLQPDPAKWSDGSWPSIAEKIGGKGLKNAMALGGLISAAGLYMVSLMASSRIPFVLAGDNILPVFFTKQHPKYGTPWVAIIFSSAIYAALSIFNFKQLAEIDVVLYSSALLLEFIALVILRVKEPDLPRPFKIPGGWWILSLVVLLPVSLIGFALYSLVMEDERTTLILLFFAIASGAVIFFLRKSGMQSTNTVSRN